MMVRLNYLCLLLHNLHMYISVSSGRWPPAVVLLLLRTYESKEQKLFSGKSSHKKIWEEISDVLVAKGYAFSAGQCASKLRNLKRTYKIVKEHNAKSGNNPRHWQYLEVSLLLFNSR